MGAPDWEWGDSWGGLGAAPGLGCLVGALGGVQVWRGQRDEGTHPSASDLEKLPLRIQRGFVTCGPGAVWQQPPGEALAACSAPGARPVSAKAPGQC